MKKFLILGLIPLFLMVPGTVFAESDYSKIGVNNADTQILEFEKYNLIRTIFTVENRDVEKFETYYLYLTANNIYYEESQSHDFDEVGSTTCPSNHLEINPGLEEEYIFCFKVPNSFPDNFELKFMSSSSERCAEKAEKSLTNQYVDPCLESTYPLGQISNPKKISYESLLKTYVKEFENMKASVSDIGLLSGENYNLLMMTLSLTNKGNSEISGYSIQTTARNLSGLEFDNTYYYDMECDSDIDDINPGLTKNTILCFEVPKNELAFDLILRSGFEDEADLSSCDGIWGDCNELFINITAPEPVDESTPEPVDEPTVSEKLPPNHVEIVKSSSIPGCEQEFLCYDPTSITVSVGDTVTWTNDDSAVHTVTSGYGTGLDWEEFAGDPDAVTIFDDFDSGMISSGQSFKHTFNESGIFPYFCLLHPWMIGEVSVESVASETTRQPEPKTSGTLGVASFVDKSKDPQYYVDRYNNEPDYKAWFDKNYPQYDSIEQAVGLELTEKIPDWVKNIFGWYAADQVSEDELLNAIKYLINEGILIVD